MSVVPQTCVTMANGRSSDSSYKVCGLPGSIQSSVAWRNNFGTSDTMCNLLKRTHSIG